MANLDVSPLEDLARYGIYHFNDGSFTYDVVDLMHPVATVYLAGNLPAGNSQFFVTAVNSRGIESPYSQLVSTFVSN
jgi:hypothetical protein